jgi:hypothetical protein
MMALGTAAFFWALWGPNPFTNPDSAGEVALAIGFGGMHIVSGVIVWRRYGG